MSFDPLTNFYCSQKFTWLSIDLEKQSLYSCCSAAPEKININWLKQNPGQLFNTPALHQDRVDMLANKPVSSCHDNCWKPESNGLTSRRTLMKSYETIPSNINESTPKHLNINLGSTCNLTCSYCCKQYSSAWYRDLKENGSYFDNQDRFQLVPIDHIISKLSHREYFESSGVNTINKEIAELGPIEQIVFSGGEPFLYNEFPELLNNLDRASCISFHTGLGVDPTRLKKQINQIKQRENLQIYVSAETCGKLYEFNRYGNSYEIFLTNLKLLKDAGFSVKFHSVISNLTVLGLVDFVNTFSDIPIKFQFCNDPDFLAVNVLDDNTKDQLINILNNTEINPRNEIISNIQVPCQEMQRRQCAHYIKEFAARRNLSLDIFPTSMLQWLDIKDSYVV
jgi:molybdenum cofactor biosynthesis enzyme MoaA